MLIGYKLITQASPVLVNREIEMISRLILALLMVLSLIGSAHAALDKRANGMVYDTTLGVTWMADMNYAKTLGLGQFRDGVMTWGGAVAWADELVYAGYNDWRLPTLNPLDSTCSMSTENPLIYFGTGCTGGELSHLFTVDIGPMSPFLASSVTDQQKANRQLLKNIQSSAYWSGTEDASGLGAWIYLADIGFQDGMDKSRGIFVPLVRTGDVAAVPEVSRWMALLLGLAVLWLLRRNWGYSRP